MYKCELNLQIIKAILKIDTKSCGCIKIKRKTILTALPT